ncbi:MAG: mechanosensitive ion channel family protein [Halobacteriaceae archaeon]
MLRPAVTVDAGPGDLRTSLEGLQTVQGRLLVTATVGLLVVFAAGWLLPRVVDWARQSIADRLGDGAVADLAALVDDNVPWAVQARVLVATLQAASVILAVLALLVVWGRVGLVDSAVTRFEQVLPTLIQVGLTGLIVWTAWLTTRLAEDVIDRMSAGDGGRMGRHEERVIYRVVQITVFAVTGLVVLSVWQVNLGGLLVGAGFAGIVVGLAARQTLGALIAGFVLMFSRPFEIGDWVEIGDQEGIVTDVSVVNTRLRTFDGEFVAIPNDRVGNSVITNRSREGSLRLRVEVGVDYETDPERAESVALAAIRDADMVTSQPAPQVVPTRFGDSAVVLELRFWIKHPSPQRRWRATASVIHAVKDAFETEGIKIPFPQRELTGRAEAGGFRVRSGDGAAGRPGTDAERG